ERRQDPARQRGGAASERQISGEGPQPAGPQQGLAGRRHGGAGHDPGTGAADAVAGRAEPGPAHGTGPDGAVERARGSGDPLLDQRRGAGRAEGRLAAGAKESGGEDRRPVTGGSGAVEERLRVDPGRALRQRAEAVRERAMKRASAVVGILLVAACLVVSSGLSGQEPSAPLTPEQKEKLKQRDELQARLRTLAQEKKWDELLETLEKIARLEQQALGPTHPKVIASLQRLAQGQVFRQHWAEAIKTGKEIVGLQEKRLGKDHWQVADARRALANTEQWSRMTAEDRQQIERARFLDQQALQLYQQGKFQEGVRPVEQALAIRKKLWGKSHPEYANSL